jgi:hypothetical protein
MRRQKTEDRSQKEERRRKKTEDREVIKDVGLGSQKYWLVGILFLVLLLRLPSWWEPYWYGDEGITLTVGRVWRAGGVIYKDIQDNKPPLLYWIAGLSGDLGTLKMVLTGWALMTVGLFWRLGKEVFKVTPPSLPLPRGGIAPVVVATLVFAILTSIPLWEGNLVNGEIFMMGPVIGAFLVLLNSKFKVQSSKLWSLRRIYKWRLFLAGGLFGVGFLFKHPAGVDLITAILLLLNPNSKFKIQSSKLRFLQGIYKLFLPVIYLGIGFLVPVAVVAGVFWWQDALGDFVKSVFLNNFLYVSRWEPLSVWGSTSAFGGELWQRLGVVLIWTGCLWIWRKRFSFTVLFIALWLGWSALGASLSGRPYPHYWLQVVPALSLAAGWIVYKLKIQNLKFKVNRSELFVVVGGLVMVWWVWARIGYWRYPTVGYYINFLSYVSSENSVENYWNFFDSRVVRDYKLSAWVRDGTVEEDEIFVWGDIPQIYVMSERLPATKYVMSYHVRDFGVEEDTLLQLRTSLPKLIVVMDESGRWEELDELMDEKYELWKTVDGGRVYQVVKFE